MRVQYVGNAPITLMTQGVGLAPGDEYEAPDELAESLLSRDDFVQVKPTTKTRRKVSETPEADLAGDAGETATGDQGTGTDTKTI